MIYYFEGQGIITVGILMKVLTTSSIQTFWDICETGGGSNVHTLGMLEYV